MSITAATDISLNATRGNIILSQSTLQISLPSGNGTAGQVLTSDGTYATWKPASGGSGGTTVSTFTDLHTSTLQVSTINGLPYSPAAAGPVGAIQYSDGAGKLQATSTFFWYESNAAIYGGPFVDETTDSNNIIFNDGGGVAINSNTGLNLNATNNIFLQSQTLQIALGGDFFK